jgi:hypothetical protein
MTRARTIPELRPRGPSLIGGSRAEIPPAGLPLQNEIRTPPSKRLSRATPQGLNCTLIFRVAVSRMTFG